MVEKQVIVALAEPILEKLRELDEAFQSHPMTELPKVHLITDESQMPIMLGNIELTSETLLALEDYLQDEIEKMVFPTILH